MLLPDEHTAATDRRVADFISNIPRCIIQKNRITTLMITRSMRRSLDFGDRILMLHGGQIILDVREEEKSGLEISDLLIKFQEARGKRLADDKLLLDWNCGAKKSS